MSKPIPAIRKYMTMNPHSIGVEQTVAKAHQMMREHGIRHLPVLHGGKLKGLVSERDLTLLESLQGVDPTKATVEDAMWSDVYCVRADAPLDEVVAAMAEHKYGSVVVLDNSAVVGIFTTVDVCRAFSELLTTRLAS